MSSLAVSHHHLQQWLVAHLMVYDIAEQEAVGIS
jgi:hypothetical protein